ncbi:unnamed protein product [Coffea canephora]|uniref:Apyrase n=1 Tax=Coffea canephora TaxID=49390 RepID=A0A068U711_COFCA|nr:unnamed protein product [Coffea canephora]
MLKQHLIAFVFVSCMPFLQTTYSLSLSGKLSNGVLLSNDASGKYAVIIDAGSTGSRLHVLHFDRNLDLVQIGQDFEFFKAIKPGLSSYADGPEAAAQSLKPLLEKAEAIVPKEFRANTPVKVGATAGLRLLKGDSSEKILQAVRDLLKNESSLKYKAEWVTILEGSQEAAYIWAAINYLLGTAGKKYSETVGTIDLGGGSVQMTYAVSKEVALKASKLSKKETYIQEKNLLGSTYHLYAYSYLNYGLLAARAEILKVSRNSSHPCILYGYHGYYTYGDVAYRASAFPTGPNMKKCRAFVLKALKINAPCKHKKCTFNGVWNGGGGDGQKNLYVASFFYDRASQVGVIKTNVPSATARPLHFLSAAKRACRTKYKDIKSVFPNINESDRPFTCLDLVYEYSLLVNGFGLNPFKKITLVKKIKYKDSLLETAWPLGSAIDAVSSQN